jgi:hypothetical protein
MIASKLPATLRTATLADGYDLARELALHTLEGSKRVPSDMAVHLSTTATRSVELLTATYFQAIAAANIGWPR